MILNFWVIAFLTTMCSCEKEELSLASGDISLKIEAGDHWMHDFPLFLGITKKNPPQFAIWIEDMEGNYVTTIFATYKIATEGWASNRGNRRMEALPYWCHQRGVLYDDGLMLPTKEMPLNDGVTGATPKADKMIQINSVHIEKPFVIKAEFNHSVDFNDSYPKNALEENDNYSGGEEGSGQPAVVYMATIFQDTREAALELSGHSSPDGSDGNIYYDTQKLTTAKSIVKSITLTVK